MQFLEELLQIKGNLNIFCCDNWDSETLCFKILLSLFFKMKHIQHLKVMSSVSFSQKKQSSTCLQLKYKNFKWLNDSVPRNDIKSISINIYDFWNKVKPIFRKVKTLKNVWEAQTISESHMKKYIKKKETNNTNRKYI